jgi:flagellar basal body-associated protein FliL
MDLNELKTILDKQESKNTNKSKQYNITKIIIVVIIVFLGLAGFLGSTKWGIFRSFNMDDFVSFISAYQGVFIALISCIGVGGIAKNGITMLKQKKEQEVDPTESIVKGDK